ncbi:hypothetical protein IFM89_016380 [Coptis chinensis]|uniref:Uncharacterized protein n=1 Tax=Coptis chinensis TaxID=261450 RepID=A0A835HDD0_9MAGN|nr:hypothetical protein IFM89_016380 [Coptis chinensis]
MRDLGFNNIPLDESCKCQNPILSPCHLGHVNDGQKYFDRIVNVYNISPMMEHYGCILVWTYGRFVWVYLGWLKNFMRLSRTCQWNQALIEKVHECLQVCGKVIQLDNILTKLLEDEPSLGANYVLDANVSAVSNNWDDEAQPESIHDSQGFEECSWV